MKIQSLIILISWISFVLYWAVSSIGVKKDVEGKRSWFWSTQGFMLRLAVAFAIILFAALRGHLLNAYDVVLRGLSVSSGSVSMTIGTILVVVGIGYAIWARAHLGRNWSSHPALKEHPELVTSGPYRYIRHPIYTGMLLAVLGSAIAVSVWWYIILIFVGVMFVRRVFKEEEILTKEFSNQYLEYKKRTWALIPFVF